MMSAMSEMTRRDFGVGTALLMALGARVQGQVGAVPQGGGSLGGSKVFPPDLKTMANGSERWGVLNGTFATGEAVSMHESVVPAGTPKGAAHTIMHSELIYVAEGTLSFQHGEMTDVAHAGSVIYVAYGTNHLVWNSGETAARYMVFQMGGDTKVPGKMMPVEGKQ